MAAKEKKFYGFPHVMTVRDMEGPENIQAGFLDCFRTHLLGAILAEASWNSAQSVGVKVEGIVDGLVERPGTLDEETNSAAVAVLVGCRTLYHMVRPRDTSCAHAFKLVVEAQDHEDATPVQDFLFKWKTALKEDEFTGPIWEDAAQTIGTNDETQAEITKMEEHIATGAAQSQQKAEEACVDAAKELATFKSDARGRSCKELEAAVKKVACKCHKRLRTICEIVLKPGWEPRDANEAEECVLSCETGDQLLRILVDPDKGFADSSPEWATVLESTKKALPLLRKQLDSKYFLPFLQALKGLELADEDRRKEVDRKARAAAAASEAGVDARVTQEVTRVIKEAVLNGEMQPPPRVGCPTLHAEMLPSLSNLSRCFVPEEERGAFISLLQLVNDVPTYYKVMGEYAALGKTPPLRYQNDQDAKRLFNTVAQVKDLNALYEKAKSVLGVEKVKKAIADTTALVEKDSSHHHTIRTKQLKDDLGEQYPIKVKPVEGGAAPPADAAHSTVEKVVAGTPDGTPWYAGLDPAAPMKAVNDAFKSNAKALGYGKLKAAVAKVEESLGGLTVLQEEFTKLKHETALCERAKKVVVSGRATLAAGMLLVHLTSGQAPEKIKILLKKEKDAQFSGDNAEEVEDALPDVMKNWMAHAHAENPIDMASDKKCPTKHKKKPAAAAAAPTPPKSKGKGKGKQPTPPAGKKK